MQQPPEVTAALKDLDAQAAKGAADLFPPGPARDAAAERMAQIYRTGFGRMLDDVVYAAAYEAAPNAAPRDKHGVIRLRTNAAPTTHFGGGGFPPAAVPKLAARGGRC